MADELRRAALEYHRLPTPGKIAITATKPLANQHDLALAYSPGVAEACLAIADDPAQASNYTARGNLVAVITNGTAVLGLGAIGPLAAKPVMEGKAVLFKKFAGIDVFDIEIERTDPDKFVEIIAALEPSFGGSISRTSRRRNASRIEEQLRQRMKIPVFHDDQHGTAIIVGAAIRNGLKLVGKKLEDVKLVTSGAGAAAIACLDLLVVDGPQDREHHRHRSLRRRLARPQGGDGPAQGSLRQGHQRAHARRGDRRRRYLPRPLGARCAEARDGRRGWRRSR